MEATSGFINSAYGQNTRLLNQAINRLRECGSEAILGEMPKIAVIGNQSAGKSSLIEAMSGVSLLLLKADEDSRSPSSWNMYPLSHGSRPISLGGTVGVPDFSEDNV
jgi:ribosome biogenesis GTPase A